jgi:hypothetical protein
MQLTDSLGQLIGKKITGVVVGRGDESPRNQIFLVFEDDTCFEIYGDLMSVASGVDRGGLDGAKKSVAWGGRRVEIYPAPKA